MPKQLPDSFDRSWPQFAETQYVWTLQTYLILKAAGLQCKITDKLNVGNGIIIAHRSSLKEDFIPSKNQLLVCIQADWGRHPYAQIHISQNRSQTTAEGQHLGYRLFWPGNTYCVHHWPQPNLVPRSQDRDMELKTLAYFGREYNLAPQLRSVEWSEFLQNLGVEWKLIDDNHVWGDYSDVDAVLCIRNFSGNKYYNKPATKLQNAWTAKCLPICTPESACLHEADLESESVVYVETYDELKRSIKMLKEDSSEFERRIRSNTALGHLYKQDVIADQWKDLLIKIREHDYPRYIRSSLRRKLFLATRGISKLLLALCGKLTP